MRVVGIRADGNGEIGTGHIFRCLSIAEKLKKEGALVYFILADDRPAEMIKNQGYEVCVLETDWKKLEGETDKLAQVIKDKGIDILLVDTYFVTKIYLDKVRKMARTAYIDDLYEFDYPVDILINYSSYANDMGYLRLSDTKYFLGTEYAPLREQFQNLEFGEKSSTRKILVLSGGTDPYHMTNLLPNALIEDRELDDYKFLVVVGMYAATNEALTQTGRVEYLKGVTDMASLMQSVDAVVSAGGTTLYELCAAAVPAVTYSFVDNQLDNVKAFDRLGVFTYAGDLRNDASGVVANIIKEIKTLLNENQSARRLHMQELVDGNGALRIARVLLSE